MHLQKALVCTVLVLPTPLEISTIPQTERVLGEGLNARVLHCVQFLPFRNNLQRKNRSETPTFVPCRAASPWELECAVINAGLDGALAAFPTIMELYIKLGLSLQFLLLSKLHSLSHHHGRLKLYILDLTVASAKRL